MLFLNALIPAGRGDETRKVHLRVRQGRIVGPAAGPEKGEETVDVEGKLLVPGGVDPHVHFDEPGFTHREDFAHGTAAAACGGVTCVIDMPCTSLPPVTDARTLESKRRIVEKSALVDFALWGGVSGLSFAEGNDWKADMDGLAAAGAAGFKTYALSGLETFPALTPEQLEAVLGKARELGLPVGHHAEDPDAVRYFTEEMKAKGRDDAEAYGLSRPAETEVLAVRRAAALARASGAHLHIVHVGSSEAAAIAAAEPNVTAETCPHFLAFGREDLRRLGSILKTAPAVKTWRDAAGLWRMLADGRIDFLATDHAPCPPEEKATGSIWTDHGGVPGVELMMAFAYSEGVACGKLTLERFVEVTSAAAARLFGLHPHKGSLEPGADADLAVIDPLLLWNVRGKDLASKGTLTPFEGALFRGRVVATYVRGTRVYDIEKGPCVPPEGRPGRFVRPARRRGAGKD